MKTFVLRKIGGVFDACLLGRGMPSGTAARIAFNPLRTLGVFAAVLLLPLIALAVLAALISGAGHSHAILAVHSLAGLAIGETTEVKQIRDELKTAFEQFKETHTALETEQKRLGTASAETDTQLKRINTQLDAIEVKFERARVSTGLARIDDDIREEREKRGPERKAFSKFVRRGSSRLSGDEMKTLASLKHWDADEGEYKALETDSDVEGGAFVPHQLANRVIQKLYLVSPFRSVASVETIGTGALEIPAEGATNFDAGWVGERASRPETTAASVRLERVPVHELYAAPKVSQTQLDDSVFDVETWMSSRIATRMAQLEGIAFIAGNGVTQPEGIKANTSIPSAQQLTILNTAFSANTTAQGADKLIDVWSTLPTFYANEGTWVLNRTTLGVLRKFKDNNNQYVWAPGGFGDGVRTGFPATLMGQPYVEMPDMDNIGVNKFPIMFGNWRSAYQIVDRVGMRVIRDNLTAKPFIILYTTKRVGGQMVLGEAVVQLKTT